MPGIPYVVGQWVRGSRFYGRSAQIEEILDGPRNWIWLLGTRRLGKTSLLKQLEYVTSRSNDRGYFPIFWDVQGADEPGELHVDFQDALLDAEDRLAEVGLSIQDVEADDLFASLGRLRRGLRSKGLRLLLLCDEVEALIHLDQKDPSLLRKLRRALQSHEDVRSVLASTIRLWELTEQKGDTSPFLHGFAPPLYIGTLTDEEARSLILQKQSDVVEGAPPFEAETVELIRSRCDNHPYLIQLLCKRYLEMGDLQEALDQVAADRMVSFFFSVDFDMLNDSERGIVTALSAQSGATSDSIHDNLAANKGTLTDSLHRLEHLGFIRRGEKRRFFLANHFFRRWLEDLVRRTTLPEGDDSAATQRLPPADEGRYSGGALGSIMDRYDLERQVGEGATGIVYKAYDRLLDAEIAVKVLRHEYSENEAALERFRQEILLSRNIAHPNIVRTYNLGRYQGKTYLIMQWVAGVTLAEKIRREAPLPPAVTCSISRKLLSALQAAHERNVLHRDIKPQNVLIDDSGEPFLMDFGMARLLGEPGITRSGIFLGTPNYASPEQASLLPLDSRSDLYSFGVLLFEMATGKLPFQAEDATSVLELHKSSPPPDPRDIESMVPDRLAEVVLRCLVKDREERYMSAKEVMKALEAL